MNKDMILGIVRHVLTALGGALATNGTVTSSELEAGIGAVITLAGLAWSIAAKKKPADGVPVNK